MSSKSGGAKKPGLITRLFSTERKSSLIPPVSPTTPGEDVTPDAQPSTADERLRQRRQRLHRLHSMDAATFHDRSTGNDGVDARSARAPQSPRSPTSPPLASAARRPHSAGKSRHGSSSSSSSASSPRPPVSPSEPRSPITPDSAKSLPTPSPPPPLVVPSKAPSQDEDAPARHHSHLGRKKHLPSSTSLPVESTTAPQSPQPPPPPPHATHPPKLVATAAAGGKKLKHKKRIRKNDDRNAVKVDFIILSCLQSSSIRRLASSRAFLPSTDSSKTSPRSFSSALPDCLHGLSPGPFLLNYSVFVFRFFLFLFLMPCARLTWPFRQLLSAHKYTITYRILSSIISAFRPFPL